MKYPIVLISLLAFTACATMDIPATYRGQKFKRTGPMALYIGGSGFAGDVLGPGTYYTGIYSTVLMVDCSTETHHDPLTVLTRDGVQFGLDIYVRFSAKCESAAVKQILTTLDPDKPEHESDKYIVSNRRLYETYIRPAIGAVVREAVSPYRANEVNEKHQEVLNAIRKRLSEVVEQHEGDLVRLYEVTLSNLDFPEVMDSANVGRAVQSILKDKAIAEQERVRAEIETAKLSKGLAEAEGLAAAAKIDAVGQALKRNPEYLSYDLQQKLPSIYADAGARGNMVITAPQPNVTIMTHGSHNTSISPQKHLRSSVAEPSPPPPMHIPRP